MHVLALLVLAALPQEPPPGSDLQRLADRVEAVHYPDGKPAPIRAFRADLRVEETAAKAEQRGEVELRASFYEWQPPGQDRRVPLIRYSLADAGKPVERGRDRDGYWGLEQGQARDLTGLGQAQNLKAAQRDTRLAQQLLRFLDPAAVLRSLRQPGPVAEEPLQLGRTEPIPCLTVCGRLDAFPLLEQAGEDAPVQLKVFVHRDTGRLVGVEARPLDGAGKPQPGRGEFVRFADHQRQGPAVLPMQLLHYLLDGGGSRSLQRKVSLVQITLAPSVRVEDFDRPRR